MLPNGMLLNDASAGFKNQGQFIAALHVSQNLGIPFADLKKQMVTTTGTGAAATSTQTKSLGQAIQDLKHTSSSTASTQVTRAEHEADNDVKSTTTTSSTQKKVKHHSESEHESGDRDDREHHDADHESRKDSHKEREHEHQSVAQQISRNQQLKIRVQGLLPAGIPLSEAARGFRSESQFLAALHASKDLGIPFAQIKGEMTGHDHDSLARAIEELKPTANAEMAAKTAQKEAAADLKATQAAHADHDADDQ